MKIVTRAITSFILFIFCSCTFAQGLVTHSDLLPPCPDSAGYYAQYIATLHQIYGNVAELTDPIHTGWTNCFASPVNVGDSSIHSFSSTAIAEVHVFGGPTFMMNAPAQVTVEVVLLSNVGNLRTFTNEMFQLDIAGGNLLPTIMIRESPVKASTGVTTIEDAGNGDFYINSYFDVWTDLSMDSGTTWIPCDTSGRMTLASHWYIMSVAENDDDFNFMLSPNPFNTSCNFSFATKIKSAVKLEVFDLNGKLISTVFNETVQPGKQNRVEFEGSALPDGVYISKFTSGNNSIYKRMVMMR